MNSPSKPVRGLFLILLLSLCLGLFSLSAVDAYASSALHNFVYKKCGNQTLGDPNLTHSTLLSSLLQELAAQSSKSNFFGTNVGDEKAAISGLFQCRGDLSSDECNNCVNKIPQDLCYGAIPARLQLSGCYLRYEAEGAQTTSRLEMLHKTCSEQKALVSYGFQEVREVAFSRVQDCVVNSNGYCEITYESMRVMAQCEGNLGACDCGECVTSAVQMAEEECGYSVWGKIYVENCFVGYSYYPNGIRGGKGYTEKGGGGGGSGKLVAIVLGGAAALSLGFVFWYFIRSWGRKHDDW